MACKIGFHPTNFQACEGIEIDWKNIPDVRNRGLLMNLVNFEIGLNLWLATMKIIPNENPKIDSKVIESTIKGKSLKIKEFLRKNNIFFECLGLLK